ncbi:NAD-dependent protein deacetylase [Xanthomonas hyacinthi]|uniref:NAD-dependent protein deacetylase n=1 Tax=Xanthomonas hyacinthi TaxID=56455 RepID=A0A2S7EYI1_9XANT|nr:NAD-dependent protein deacetylase [Xanthomonas hyacinthi]KLD77769.1 NAD-dependent deacetylase [Xanthomonas hyacinthi DSM 19077]PPU98097.1 NAD-dependent deacetylase [Xanthomonas hyacinthi]QGY76865.1 NAD-dependent protein deacetylase [Xanthomonas hyacinthi]
MRPLPQHHASADAAALQAFLARHRRLLVLTGAGCSTDSGIPDYRDAAGDWKRAQPVTYQVFMGELATRQRYWARSLVGWPRFGHARPNATHAALAQLEARGQVELLLTQNVDRLHQAAGSEAVIDLHGRLDVVRCMGCERRLPREDFQQQLLQRNPHWATLQAGQAPDGDADLEDVDFAAFAVPACTRCGGVLKPDVVFFGENVPRARVAAAFAHLQQADAMLVLGSSLMVYSGFRFVQAAARAGLPIAAVNLGRTRGDDLLSLKLAQPCAQALDFLLPPVAA